MLPTVVEVADTVCDADCSMFFVAYELSDLLPYRLYLDIGRD